MSTVEKSERSRAYGLGAIGSLLTVAGILASGPLALPVVALVKSQPPWAGPDLFVESFHRIQTLPFYFGFLLVTGSVLMLVSVYELSKRRAMALAGLVFMSMGGAFAIMNYVMQTTFIPAMAEGYTPALGPIVTALSMANPRALAWAIEMWAYGLMGLGTWFVAGFFEGGRLERITRALFVLNGAASIFGAVIASIDLGSVFSLAGLIGYGIWNVLYLALAVAFYRVLRERRARG